ncbi:hypothetical protein DNF23_07440 [Pseudomonas syringae pv. pisi]
MNAGSTAKRIMSSPSVRTIDESDSIRQVVMSEIHAARMNVSSTRTDFLVVVRVAERAIFFAYIMVTSCS